MPAANHDYTFPIKITKGPQRFLIQFLTIPQLTASGEIYAEAEYYAYRVLADHLLTLKNDPAKIQALTGTTANEPVDDHSFLSNILVPQNLDPHKMQAQFVIPRDSPEHAHSEINKITKLINEEPHE
ncbi:MAG: hypothetical protein L0H99_08965 [Loigolactobacillus coryniformis]|jgi:hypothetical protein|uniref:Uncharacterized protein n=1 Tax=Loigolactobacillus coryniformis subsp. coryniformis KCTC 3167 = DSM 20001 TaxID=913848 RepID=A0A0R1EX10_9LACO|nr:hypothetical protein [Loigolactobacillus coryniformis]OEH89580.1 hypothetical protein ATO00_10405 [Loigolactobacillus coryniformis subsp. coryniformis]ATO55858.1 hypothetical protein LC20001_09555 [Loigolactobacillus coryniformis subsp. coryniformis KCTC 3167 = DSM 20001]KRK14041.1 hypothetical protein FD22_GL000269 [Loigolactobacillus coryniformis subsp. coryniformis KCTC 3167 = DSM 20001]MBW4802901.1 hypothetical protein [Loigolactobacillus coryniformis subsp. torquens]MBW4805599.1 hypoth